MEALLTRRGEDRPFLRETPCECGELPLLLEGAYICTNPGCPRYGDEAWEEPTAS